MKRSLFALFGLLLSAGPLASSALAQAAPVPGSAARPELRSSLALLGGRFSYDYGGDQWFPMAGLAASHTLSPWIVAEARVARAAVAAEGIAFTSAGVEVFEISTPITTADLGLQLQAPLPYVQPYLGVSVGLLARGGDAEMTERFVRPAVSAALGARVPLAKRLVLRGELLRVRLDAHPHADTPAVDAEMTLGFGWRF